VILFLKALFELGVGDRPRVTVRQVKRKGRGRARDLSGRQALRLHANRLDVVLLDRNAESAGADVREPDREIRLDVIRQPFAVFAVELRVKAAIPFRKSRR